MSPYDSATATVDSSTLKICYSRPSAKGRVVFGELVPLDTLWRTGANEPTILHVSDPGSVAGLAVEPGSYSIYTVPTSAEWTVVVNASTTQWGLTRDERGPRGVLQPNAYTEDVRAREIGRAQVRTDSIPFVEQLTIGFSEPSGDQVELWIDWERTRAIIPIQIHPHG